MKMPSRVSGVGLWVRPTFGVAEGNPVLGTTLRAHLTQQIKNLGVKLSSIIADAGYGSEENYQWLETKHITAMLKTGTSIAISMEAKSVSILTGESKTQLEKVLFCQKLFYQHYCAQF